MTLCGICFDDKSTCFTNCNHYFCKTCIHTWLNIKHNCPSCRAYVNKNLLTNILHTLTKIKTRSKTLEDRKWNLLTSVDLFLESIKNPGPISYKMNIIDNLFKTAYNNFIIIKNDAELSKSLFESLEILKKDKTIIDSGYLDKIKIWDYKFNNF
tara:strand:+ start:789 stop:1250 length:462 start_codon:yes stop_codon:yes gene_type:complete